MLIIGCDYHPSFQQIAFVDTDTEELRERRLEHREEAEKFYRGLGAQGMKVRVGMEASGHARWFERLLAELNFELWIGDAAVIRTKRVRKQKTDRQDAQLILQLMLEDRFPRRAPHLLKLDRLQLMQPLPDRGCVDHPRPPRRPREKGWPLGNKCSNVCAN
jgi:transposase